MPGVNHTIRHTLTFITIMSFKQAYSLWEIYGTSPFTISDLFNKVNFPLLNASTSDSIVSLRENFPEISTKALKSTRSMAWVLRRMKYRKISGKVLMQQEDPNLNYRPYRLKEYQAS